jgi:hypothetical protein
LDRLSSETTPGATRPVVEKTQELLDQSRFDPKNPPKVVDPQLEATLQNELARYQRALATANDPAGRVAQTAQANIDRTLARIDANRGPTFQNQLDLRGLTSRDYEKSGVPVNQRVLDQVNDVQSRTLRNAAKEAGMHPTLFDLRNAEYGRLADQRDFFQPLRDASGQGEAYNAVFTGEQAQNADRLRALAEHAQDETRRLAANEFEYRTRGQGAGFPGVSAETLNTKTPPVWWKEQPEEFRSLIAEPGTPERAKTAALMETMNFDARRPTRTLPGRGGNTIGAPQAMFQNPVGLGSLASLIAKAAVPSTGATVGGFAAGPIGALAGAVLPTAVAHTVGRAFTNPNFVERVVNPPRWLHDAQLSRLLAASVAGRNQQQ